MSKDLESFELMDWLRMAWEVELSVRKGVTLMGCICNSSMVDMYMGHAILPPM